MIIQNQVLVQVPQYLNIASIQAIDSQGNTKQFNSILNNTPDLIVKSINNYKISARNSEEAIYRNEHTHTQWDQLKVSNKTMYNM